MINDTYAHTYYFWFRVTLFSSTSSSFPIVSGSPSHSSIPAKSFAMVNKIETGENNKPYSDIMLRS